MEMASTEHLNHSTMSETMQQENPLSVVFDNYFAVKDALVKTDGNMASVKAKNCFQPLVRFKWVNFQWTFIWFG